MDLCFLMFSLPFIMIFHPVTLQYFAVVCGNLFIFPLEPLANLHCSNIFTSLQKMFYLVNNFLDVIASDICLLSHAGPFLHPATDIKAPS